MEFFALCLKIITKEQNKFYLKLKAADFPQLSNSDANFNLIPMRCAYVYKYGTSTLYFMHDLIKNVFLHPAKSLQISKVLSKLGKGTELKLSSFSPGPGLEIIAFMLAFAKDSFSAPPSFKDIKIISKYGAWRNTVNLIMDELEKEPLVDLPASFINRNNVELIQGDIASSFTLKVKAGISNSDVILMMKALNISSENGQETDLFPVLSDFISFLNEDALIFCLDTKPSVFILMKVLAKFSGNYLVAPEHFSKKLPVVFPDVYKDLYGSLPILSTRGAFFVWQKKASSTSSKASSFPAVPLHLSSSDLSVDMNQENNSHLEEKSECNQVSSLQTLNVSQSTVGDLKTQCAVSLLVEELKEQGTATSFVGEFKDQCMSESAARQKESTYKPTVSELENQCISESAVPDKQGTSVSTVEEYQCSTESSVGDLNQCVPESDVEESKQQGSPESTLGEEKIPCLLVSTFEEIKNRCISVSTIEEVKSICTCDSTVEELNNLHISESTAVELKNEFTSESDAEDLKQQGTSESSVMKLKNQNAYKSVVGDEQSTSESAANHFTSKLIPEVFKNQFMVESDVIEFKQQGKFDSTVEQLQKKCTSKLSDGQSNNQSTPESTMEIMNSQCTFEKIIIENSVNPVLNDFEPKSAQKTEHELLSETSNSLKIPDMAHLVDFNTTQNIYLSEAKEKDDEIPVMTEVQPEHSDKIKHNCMSSKLSIKHNEMVAKEIGKKNSLIEKNHANNVKVIDVLLRLNDEQKHNDKKKIDSEIKELGPDMLNSNTESNGMRNLSIKELCMSKHQERGNLNESDIVIDMKKECETLSKSNTENILNAVIKDTIHVTESTNVGDAHVVSTKQILNNSIDIKPSGLGASLINNSMSTSSIKLEEFSKKNLSEKLLYATTRTQQGCSLSINKSGNVDNIPQEIKSGPFENGSNSFSPSEEIKTGARKKSPINAKNSVSAMKNQSVQTNLISEEKETCQRIEILEMRIKQLASSFGQLNLNGKFICESMKGHITENVPHFASKQYSNNVETNCCAVENHEQKTSARDPDTLEDNYCPTVKNIGKSESNSEHHCCNSLLDLHQSHNLCRSVSSCPMSESYCRKCAILSDTRNNFCYKNYENLHCYSHLHHFYRNVCCSSSERMLCMNTCYECHNQRPNSATRCHYLLNEGPKCYKVPVKEKCVLLEGSSKPCCNSRSTSFNSACNAEEIPFEKNPQIVIPLNNVSCDTLTQILKLLEKTNVKE